MAGGMETDDPHIFSMAGEQNPEHGKSLTGSDKGSFNVDQHSISNSREPDAPGKLSARLLGMKATALSCGMSIVSVWY